MAGDLGSMHADVTKVRQILFNLLSNACKFTENGTVTLDVERRARNRRPARLPRQRHRHRHDAGAAEERCSSTFAQADSSTSRKYGGTGLGLAISLRFTHMMRGDIHVASQSGEGSVFTVELPGTGADSSRFAAGAAGGGAARAGAPRRATPTTVLVIDDDSTVRDLMTRLLGQDGIPRGAGADGADGLRLARETPPERHHARRRDAAT